MELDVLSPVELMTQSSGCRIAMIVFLCTLGAAQAGWCASPADEPQSSREAAGSEVPSGAIESVEQANAALEAAAKERTRADAEYKARKSECFSKFLATPCVEREKKLYQNRIAKLHAVELTANRFLRQERSRQVEQRRRTTEEERARSAEQHATAAAQKQEKTPQAPVRRTAPKQEKSARTPSMESKHRHAPAVRAVDDAQTRRLNAEKYQKKETEAAERREMTAKTRAEKIEKRERKAAQREADQRKKAGISIPAVPENRPASP